MSALTQSIGSTSAICEPAVTHPVPFVTAHETSYGLLVRSALLSGILHLLFFLVIVIVSYWKSTGIGATPHVEVMNVSIVPLSALETSLPAGAQHQTANEPDATHKQRPPPNNRHTSQTLENATELVSKKSVAAPKTTTDQPKNSSQSPSSESIQERTANERIGVSNGDATSVEEARISYQDMVATMLARSKRYPERALRRRMTGEGAIRIEISADGSLSHFEIIRSTEAPILDEELRAMVERAGPFPAFPRDLQKKSLALVVPIVFRLDS